MTKKIELLFKHSLLGSFVLCLWQALTNTLASEAVERPSLSFQGVDHVHGGDCLPVRVLCVDDCFADHVLEEQPQHATGLVVDLPRDALHSAASSQASDGRLGNSLNVVPEHLRVALSTESLSAFAAFSTS